MSSSQQQQQPPQPNNDQQYESEMWTKKFTHLSRTGLPFFIGPSYRLMEEAIKNNKPISSVFYPKIGNTAHQVKFFANFMSLTAALAAVASSSNASHSPSPLSDNSVSDNTEPNVVSSEKANQSSVRTEMTLRSGQRKYAKDIAIAGTSNTVPNADINAPSTSGTSSKRKAPNKRSVRPPPPRQNGPREPTSRVPNPDLDFYGSDFDTQEGEVRDRNRAEFPPFRIYAQRPESPCPLDQDPEHENSDYVFSENEADLDGDFIPGGKKRRTRAKGGPKKP